MLIVRPAAYTEVFATVALIGFFMLSTASCAQTDKTTRLEWSKAVELVRACDVLSVYQGHDLTVRLKTTEGNFILTEAPRIDEVLIILSERSGCDPIQLIIE